ncbi:MAG: hypothetical protein SF339_22430 [Blastocatellia bacterium]|nr:hypothetical protein [Blastocatellia bacterium]
MEASTTRSIKIPRRALLIGGLAVVIAVILLLTMAPKPVAAFRQAVAKRWSESAAVQRALTLAPQSIRRAAKEAMTPAGSVAVFGAPINKIASPPDGTPVARGQQITYTITVQNDAAADVTYVPNRLLIRDSIPANTTYAPGSLTILQQPGNQSDPWTCSFDGGNNRIECTAGEGGDLSQLAIVKVQFAVTVNNDAPLGGTISNAAQFINEQPPGDGTDTSETVNHPVAAPADLALTKTSSSLVPGSVTAGGTSAALPAANGSGDITYELAIGNNGPNDAQSVVVEDQPPNNTILVSAPALDASTVTVNNVATAGFAINCAVNASQGNFITCRPGDNSGLNPGWTENILPAGFRGTIRYRVRVPASVPQGTLIENRAGIASRALAGQPNAVTADPNAANNTSLPVNTQVVLAANLTISKIVQSAMTEASNPNQTGPLGPASPSGAVATPGAATTGTAVVPGTPLTYRITVTNEGPSDAVNVQMVDTLPAGVALVSARQVSGNATFNCGAIGNVVTCAAPVLPATQTNIGNTAVIDIAVRIDPSTKTALVNNAQITGTATGLNTPVGAATTLTTPVQPVSDLITSKTHTPEPATAGLDVVYTIKVINAGPSTAAMLQIVDNLPTGQTLKSAEVLFPLTLPGMPQAMTCTVTTPAAGAAGDVVTCVGSMAGGFALRPDEFVTLRVTARIDPCVEAGVYTNVVTATSMSNLPTPAHNVATDNVTVKVVSDMAITKTDSPDPVLAGRELTFTMEAVNNGPSCARNVMIIDQVSPATLPPGTVYLSHVASPGANVITPAVGQPGQVMATWPGVTTVGQKRTLTITVRVCADYEQVFLPNGKRMCEPNLTNTATVKSDSEEPNPANNTATTETTVQAQSDLEILKSVVPTTAVFSTTGNDSIVTFTINFRNLGPSNAANTVIVDTLPKGFTVVGQPTTDYPGTTFQVVTEAGISKVTASLGAFGAANQCSLNRPTTGTIVIRAKVPIKHPTDEVANVAEITTTNCLPDPNLANNRSVAKLQIVPPGEIGQSYPARAEVTDDKAGSILFFPIYTSDAGNANSQNTRISITNISGTEKACVHLFIVDGASCSIADAFVCLTPQQTASFLASDLDPGSTGYIMAVSVDCETGLPNAYNCLIGDEFVKFASGHRANLGAEAISAVMMFPGGTDPNVTSTTLRFDGMFYNRLPRVLAVDNIASAVDGNSTLFILNRVGGNLAASGASIGNLAGIVYDDAETAYSFTANLGVCQYRTVLSNAFPRLQSTFNRAIPAGRTGWMKFWTLEDRALFGAALNFTPNAAAASGAFNQGHNLHSLRLTEAATIEVPVYIPSC